MRAALPVLAALLAGCLASPLPAPGLLALDLTAPVRIDSTQPAREPAIVEAPDGTLFVSGFWGFGRVTEYPGTPANILQAPLLWRSLDGGATWERLDVGLPLDGAIGNSDNDLAVAEDGTLYFTTLSYYSPPTLPFAPPEGLPLPTATTLTVVVGASPDNGATWAWNALDQGSMRSHPWVAAAPSGRAHVVWADGMGLRHAFSDDRGATWAQQERPHDAGEAGGISIAPDGAIAVRVAPIGSEADGVVLSTDDGGSWAFFATPGARGGDTPQGFDPVAFDAAGFLYFAWAEGQALRAARSADGGASWSTFAVATEPEGTQLYFPFLRADRAGELALTWFALTGEVVAARAALVTGADGASPVVRAATLLDDTGGTNHADYFMSGFLRSRGLGVPVPVTTPDLGQWFDFVVAR